MTDQDMKNLESLFQSYVGVFTEDLQSKLDLVVEGHAALDQKIDRKFDQNITLKVKVSDAITEIIKNKFPIIEINSLA